MEFTMRNVQGILGLAVLLILLGWCLWRLVGWAGIFSFKPAKQMTRKNQAELKGRKSQKKPVGTFSKQAFYSKKRIS